jgi:DNA-binding CsgD family transcriptional regulator
MAAVLSHAADVVTVSLQTSRWPEHRATTYALAMSGEVFGRDAELLRIEGFLGDLTTHAEVLVLAGEAGAGKTTLLRRAADLAASRDMTVLRTAPSRGDLRLAFAGLADLLERRLDEVAGDLPAVHASALRVALLMDDSPARAPEPRTIAAAFRGALTALAATSPVLLVVDDVQWLDSASEAAIGYAVRRLEHERVGLLCAQRTYSPGAELPLELDRARLTAAVLPIGGLSLGALHRMLHSTLGAAFPSPVLRRIETGSGGNPFIALEIGRAMLRRGSGTGVVLPVPETLADLVGERLGALPAEVLASLEVVALMPHASIDQYLACGADSAALDAGVRAAVLEHPADRLDFTHPVLAAAVFAATPPARRRKLHAAAARVSALPEERARHRALAAATPSAEVAAELADAAAAAAARGAPSAAAELFDLSATLTPPGELALASRRRLDSALQLALAGDMDGARSLLERIAEIAPPGGERADALSQLGLLLEDDYPRAAGLMERALTEAGDDPARTADIRIALCDICSIQGDVAKAVEVGGQALSDAERSGDPALLAASLAQAFELQVRYAGAADPGLLSKALALEPQDASLVLRTPATWVAGEYHILTGQLDVAEAEFTGLAARVEAAGVEYFRAHVLRFLSAIALLRGDARRAAALAAEGLQIAEQLSFPHSVSMALFACALPALQLGRAQEVRDMADRGLQLARQTGEEPYVLLHRALPGCLDLALGDVSAAVGRLRPLASRFEAVGMRVTSPGLFADAAEALVAAGDLDEAGRIVASLEAAMPSPVTAALVARCRGALAAGTGDLAAATGYLDAALALHDEASPIPVQRGRTLLMLGVVQRRLKQRALARATLSEALSVFEEVEAPLWAARAKAEIARISGRSAGPEALTESERRVAELVAGGMSNSRVAAELFVTVRAVESTLTKAYIKLGVRSRTELASRLRDG